MNALIWIGLFSPLLGFLILLALSGVLNRKIISLIGCGSVFISFCCFTILVALFQIHDMMPFKEMLFTWIPIKSINADFAVLIDSLSLLMTLIITGVGFLIHVYSIGYMEHDEDYARYFSCMNLFIFAMLLLVLSSNLVLMFVGWEGVGLASYLLIGYYYSRVAAAKAATKAFVVNRIGDLGFLLGLFLTFQTFGTADIMDICKMAESYPAGSTVLTILTLLLFVGAIGKSAQIPLHVWLADAMEGPTPVSALIHAATMVTAGVFLLARVHCIYLLAPFTLQVVGLVGIITSLFAAFTAVGQTDLKRVLAYSTVSQLGLMFLACGVGAFYAAMFHLTMHAFVKALLFLSAGNVVHMMHGTTDMGNMGGLKAILTKTHVFFLLGVLALSGFPPLAGFFSKDLILEQEHQTGHDILFFMGLVVTVFTAFYLTRAYCLTFLGSARIEKKILKVVHEAPSIMLGPIFILAFLSITGGFLGFSPHEVPVLEDFLEESDITLADHTHSIGFHVSLAMLLSIFSAALGFVSAWWMYSDGFIKKPIALLKQAFYFDAIYQTLIVYPLKSFAYLIAILFETKFFMGSIDAAASLARNISFVFQRMQSGQIRSYISWMMLGLFVIIIFMFV